MLIVVERTKGGLIYQCENCKSEKFTAEKKKGFVEIKCSSCGWIVHIGEAYFVEE